MGPLKGAGSGRYNWVCSISPLCGIDVTYSVRPGECIGLNGNPIDGNSSRKDFCFLANNAGVYTVHLKLASTWEPDPIDEITFTIVVTE